MRVARSLAASPLARPRLFYNNVQPRQADTTPLPIPARQLIHLLLLGFVVYQFFDKGKEIIVDKSVPFPRISLSPLRSCLTLHFPPLPPSPTARPLIRIQWRFALLGLLSAGATWLQIRGYHVTTFVFSLLVSATVSTIYYIVRQNHRHTLPDELFVHLPFSLYHAWALVLVVLSGFDAFGVEKMHHHAGVWTKVFVFLALMFLETSAVGCQLPLSPRLFLARTFN